MEYMLDTNICIYIIKQKPESVIKKLIKVPIGDVYISSITLAELEYGVSKSKYFVQNKIALTQFISPIVILPYTDECAIIYGKIRASLEGIGKTIGPMDLLIASHALAGNMVLVTNNTSEFKRIPHLKIVNWI
jgi:tRNA(fMet)-specific endonuclease VapC